MAIGFFCNHEFNWPWKERESNNQDKQKFVNLLRSCLSDSNFFFNWLYYAEVQGNSDSHDENERDDVSSISQSLLLVACITGTLSYFLALAHGNRANLLCALFVWMTRICKVACVYPFFVLIFTIKYARHNWHNCDIDAEPEDSQTGVWRHLGNSEHHLNSYINSRYTRLPEYVAYAILTIVDPFFDYVESRIRAGLDIRPGFISFICILFDDVPQITITSWTEASEGKDVFSNIALLNLILSVEILLYRSAEMSDNCKSWFIASDESILTVYGKAKAVSGLSAHSFLSVTAGTINQWKFHKRHEQLNINHCSGSFKKILTTHPLNTFYVNDVKTFKMVGNSNHDDENTRVSSLCSSTGCSQVVAVGSYRLGKIFHMHSHDGDELRPVQDLYGNFVADVHVRRVFASCNGSLILTADSTPPSDRIFLRCWPWHSESQMFHFKKSFDLGFSLYNIAFFPDQDDKFVTVNKNGLAIWDLVHSDAISLLEVLDSSCALVIDDNNVVVGTKEGTISKFCIESWMKSVSYKGHTNKVTSMCRLCLSEENLSVLSASFDKTIKMWNVESGVCIKTWEGHNGPIRFMALLPDLEYFVTASTDWTCKVWSLRDAVNIDCVSYTGNRETTTKRAADNEDQKTVDKENKNSS